MSCNGCRVLRKGCSEGCVLRPCLQWIDGAEAQGHATVFVAKFFGRAGLMSFLTAVPEPQRAAVFQSLLYEAAGRTINPVGGAVGLLSGGSWHLCQAAVDTVLRGGGIQPLPDQVDAAAAGGRDVFASTARRAVGGCSTFSTAKRSTTTTTTKNPGTPHDAAAAAPQPEPSCDLGLWLSPGSPPAPGDRRSGGRRADTPSMNSEGSVTTCGVVGGGEREPELLNLFV
ncbi:LOB domain-containing protein 37-like [Oryza glaberrima]|uniref:LOB domain-containing protein n=3 Tax=Oryza TaxID=4527 RepID=A0A0D3GT01_9ORYZ|nr:LOB domain-containing protein 37-like [Oryza glaberrima]